MSVNPIMVENQLCTAGLDISRVYLQVWSNWVRFFTQWVGRVLGSGWVYELVGRVRSSQIKVIHGQLWMTVQLFVGAMGPPGGGRNDISSRFMRHLQIVSIDDFDENTMLRIFYAISEWHFSKGYESVFMRMGKVCIIVII